MFNFFKKSKSNQSQQKIIVRSEYGNVDLNSYNNNPQYEDFKKKYESQDIAKRIVDIYPASTWGGKLDILENDKADDDITEFENQFSFLKDKFKLITVFEKADKLANIGFYSTIVIGFTNDFDLSQPLQKQNKLEDLIYVKAFSEVDCTIYKEYEDISNPKYGLPEFYHVGSNLIHESRVIHIVNDELFSNIYGTPRLKPIYNRLDDLQKIISSSADMFYFNGRAGIHFNYTGDRELPDIDQVKSSVQALATSRNRVMITQETELKPIEFSTPDPTNNFNILIDVISGAVGIPKRLLLGSERGELSSSQDQDNWNNAIKKRRVVFAENKILRVFIDKLMDLGVLQQVEYGFIWDDLDQISAEASADIALKTTQSIVSYANSPSADSIISKKRYMEEVLKMNFEDIDLEDIDLEDQDEDLEN